ncbi:MAG: thioesterase family protein [Acidobacteria bacterium]|nr:thioesterase family protein [Acidobacteriota bacterium]
MTLELPAATDLRTLLTLEAVSPDVFLAPSGFTGWGRLYGGQVIAQALMAAARTVDPEQRPHSLHAYYVRQGEEPAPVAFEVQRVRDGRSFSTRQVVASQAGGAILNLIASFHRPEPSEERESSSMPAGAPRPEQLDDDETPLFFQSRAVRDEFDMATLAWMRTLEDLEDDPVLNACALAYLSDEHLLGAALTGHSLIGDWERLMTASLDHALWFHHPVRVRDWHCFVLEGQAMADARGLSIAKIFDAEGLHVATAAQEALVRLRR